MGTWGTVGVGRVLLVSLILGGGAVAQEQVKVDPEGEGIAEEREPITAEPRVEKKPKAEKPAGPTINVYGRVFARGMADERAKYDRDLELSSARLGVEASLEFADAVVEADLSAKNVLRDAFVRVHDDADQLRLYGGRFKAPFMARVLESSWDLPIMTRGLVEDYLVETNDLGGRRFGLMGEGRWKQLSGLKVAAGIFQGSEDVDTGKRLGEDASARLSFKPFKKLLTVGASGYLAQVGQRARRYGYGADATLGLGGLAVTVEGLTGRVTPGRFMSGTVLASYNVMVTAKWIVQPALSAEYLMLHSDQDGPGQGNAATAGLNFIYDDRFKLMLQGERAMRPGDERAFTEFGAQLGARF